MATGRQEEILSFIKSQANTHDRRGPSLVDILIRFEPIGDDDREGITQEIQELEKAGLVKKDERAMQNWIDHENLYFQPDLVGGRSGLAARLLGRCKGCGQVYDLNQQKDCPTCGRYSGSQLDSVDLLEPGNGVDPIGPEALERPATSGKPIASEMGAQNRSIPAQRPTMASDFSGNNSEKIDKLVASVIELRTTLRICFAVLSVGLPLMIGLLTFVVVQSFGTSAKMDRLSDQIATISRDYAKLSDRLDRLERSGRP